MTPAPLRAVTGHVDTLGAIVTQIKPNGRLVFDSSGISILPVNGDSLHWDGAPTPARRCS
jgi:hypothetical protein